LAVYDGVDDEAPSRIGRYCGHRLPPDAVSSGPAILVVLETDASVNDGGFNVTWTSEIVEGQTRISSPRKYFACQHCTGYISEQ